MSFTEKTSYGIECDDCGTTLQDPTGSTVFVSHYTTAADIAVHSGWCPMGFGIHICPTCAHARDTYGELIS